MPYESIDLVRRPATTESAKANAMFAELYSMFGVITGDPEGVVTAPPGAIRYSTDLKLLYVKETGTGNTGWSR